jgi:hypothetical protein
MPVENTVDVAVCQRILSDDTSDDGSDLKTLTGPAFSRPDLLTMYNGQEDSTNNFPDMAYYSEEKNKFQDKRVSELTIRIRDNDQERVKLIRKRLIDLLTGPFEVRSTFQRIVPEGARIASIQLSDEQDGVDTNTKVYFVTLVFLIRYVLV